MSSAVLRTGYIIIALFLLLRGTAHAQTAPDGWMTVQRAGGAVVYTPPNLAPGETYSVAVYPHTTLGSSTLALWFVNAAGKDPIPPGTAQGPVEVKVSNPVVVVGSRIFTAPGGVTIGGVYSAMSYDGQAVQLVRMVFTTQGGLVVRYKAPTSQITQAVIAGLKSAQGGAAPARAAGGLTPGGLTPGGKIVPGVYVGDQHNGNEGIRQRFRLYLYADGEYRLCDENDKDYRFNTGRYEYDTSRGRLTVGNTFDLDNEDAVGDSCLYGTGADGKPLIRSSSDHGLYNVWAEIRYAGPTTRPSPEAEEQAKTAAEAEAKRYKWVTPVGKGLKQSQIAGVWHDYDVRVSYGGAGGLNTNVTDFSYLLLADGTVHKGLPVAPDCLDVAKSRGMEPDAWGRWRREGGKVVASWRGGPWQALPGRMTLPGAERQRLAGHWGAGSSSANMMGGSYALWGVTLTEAGRFTKDRQGGSANSTFAQTGGAPEINSGYDDSGSYASVTGPNFVALSKHKKNPNGGREGTYAIDGYVLTLHYDDGRVQHLPFFFDDAALRQMYFEDSTVGRDDDRK